MQKITSLQDFEKAFGVEHLSKEDVGLENIKKCLTTLGNPEKKLNAIIHLAGTNGKGSTSAALESIINAHGNSVALHTSPHLVSYTERFRINKQPISEEELIAYCNKLYIHIQKENLFISLFEALTIIAILYFADQNVEYAIFETGLGGRLDATNILPSSLQIITKISFDHMNFLGDTIEQIAFEKASIIKEKSTVVTPNTGKSLEIISDFAKKTHSNLITQSDFTISSQNVTREGTTFDLDFKEKYQLHTNLIGQHQAENTSLAFIAANELLPDFSMEKVQKGLNTIIWPGRFQIISENPHIILDGAHNQNGVDALINTLNNTSIQPDCIFYTSKAGKDHTYALTQLKKVTQNIILVDLEHFLIDTEGVSNDFPDLERIKIEDMLQEIHKKTAQTVLITGSLYFIGEFLKHANAHFPFNKLPNITAAQQ